MKRSLWIFPFALLVAVSAGAVEPEGFGGLLWGDPVPKGWKLTKNGESQICSKSSRGTTFGSTHLEKVEYEFEGGRLVGVALFLKERSGFLAAKKELESCFEAPGILARVSPASESYHWNGKATFADLYYLGEGLLSALFLSWEPSPGMLGSPGVSLTPAQERLLQYRLRLCAEVAKVLDKTIDAWEQRASDYDSSNWLTPPVCQSRTEIAAEQERAKSDQEVRASLSKRELAVSERGRVQREMDQLKSELDALRAARLATIHSAPTSFVPVPAPSPPHIP